ncbi:MAG: protein jag [Oscillospiraceae bacterium]|jgi:spoIIIJ-associated protein|nr:protein jag [Oscillospiraceae bacterium]
MKITRQFSAKTEDDAIELALSSIGLSANEVEFDIVQPSKKGVFGIGGTQAVVNATFEAENEESVPEAIPAAADEEGESEQDELFGQKAKRDDAGHQRRRHTRNLPEEDRTARTAIALEFLSGLLERFGAEATAEVGEYSDGYLTITLSSPQASLIIGRRGETLSAIQSLVNFAVNKNEREHLRIIFDIEDYRAKRRETLEHVAKRTAENVLRSGKSYALEPMSAYERHIIHAFLQDRPDITTFSYGDEPNRRLVICLPGEEGKPPRQFSDRDSRGGRNDRRGGRDSRGGSRGGGYRDRRDAPKPVAAPLPDNGDDYGSKTDYEAYLAEKAEKLNQQRFSDYSDYVGSDGEDKKGGEDAPKNYREWS